MSYRELIEKALHGRSVNQAAKDLGMQQTTLNRYARGDRLPDYDDALRLAHEAGIGEAEAFQILAAEAARKKQTKSAVVLRHAGAVAATVVMTVSGVMGGAADAKAQQVVRPAGIEPATPAFGGQYSIH